MKYIISYIREPNKNKIKKITYQENDYILLPDEKEVEKDIFLHLTELISIPNTKVYFINDLESVKDIIYELPTYAPVTFRYLISFVEVNNYRLLGGLTVIESTNDFDKKCFIETTEEIYIKLKSKILEMQSGKVKTKNKTSKITNLDDIIFEFGELKKEDLFELDKVMTIRRMYNSLFKHLDERVLYNFFNFTMRNNELMSHGIFICDENREEIYLKIIQEADSEDSAVKKNAEKKIDLLSDYLESYDALREHFKIYEIFKKFEETIYDCESKEELEKIYNSYNEKM